MTRLVKIIDNKYVQIEEYKKPNICFNTNKYSDFEDYCTLRETFDPFKMFYENIQLQQRINKALNKIDNMFDKGDENSIIDDLLELDKILRKNEV